MNYLVIALAVLVLVDWALHLSLLTSIVPGFATIKPKAALCFGLAGIAL